MQDLHLVGFTTDRKHLIFSTRRGAKSGSFVVPVDEALLAAVEDLANDPVRAEDEVTPEEIVAPPPPRIDAKLSVREVQARLRSGESAPDVARDAGVAEEWVERFAPPVRAEQRQVVERALTRRMERPRTGESAKPLGIAVAAAMAERGVTLTDDGFANAWSSRLVGQDHWVIEFRFTQRGRKRVVAWTFDSGAGRITTNDRTASQIGFVAPPKSDVKATKAKSKSKKAPTSSTSATAQPSTPSGDGRPDSAKSTAAVKKAAASTKKAAAKKKPAKKAASKKAPVKKKAVKKKAPAKKKAPVKKKAPAKKKAVKKKAVKKKAPAKKAAKKKAPAKEKPVTKTSIAKVPPAEETSSAPVVTEESPVDDATDTGQAPVSLDPAPSSDEGATDTQNDDGPTPDAVVDVVDPAPEDDAPDLESVVDDPAPEDIDPDDVPESIERADEVDEETEATAEDESAQDNRVRVRRPEASRSEGRRLVRPSNVSEAPEPEAPEAEDPAPADRTDPWASTPTRPTAEFRSGAAVQAGSSEQAQRASAPPPSPSPQPENPTTRERTENGASNGRRARRTRQLRAR